MTKQLSAEQLLQCNIARPHNDDGGLFVGDTTFDSNANSINFSTSGHTCAVSEVVQKFSSHAGTHADSPDHFQSDGEISAFNSNQYSGSAIIVDVSNRLGNELQVTRDMIEDELSDMNLDPYINDSRMLIRTNSNNLYSKDPQDSFPHFSVPVAEFLAEINCPMVGIDTPCVDRVDEKDLLEAVHGALAKARIAIVENIDPSQFRTVRGTVATFFDKTRSFKDAKGISTMLFIPSSAYESHSRG